MSVLLTLFAALLAVAIIGLVAWEVVHRRSPLTRGWVAPTMPERVTGGLGMRIAGQPHYRLRDDEPQTIVLLHGLGGTSGYFGGLYDGLAAEHRVVAIDLLGFGRSLDDQRLDHSLDDHVRALDAALDSIGAGADRVCLAAHSMGSAVALAWAARHPGRALDVVLWGPPTYPATMTDDEIIGGSGVLTRLVWSDRPAATHLTDWISRHRWAAGWLMSAVAPAFPVSIARSAALHTRAGYRGSMTSLVLGAPWPELFGDVAAPVTVFRGTDDPVGRRSALTASARPGSLMDGRPSVRIVDVDGGGHHLPLTRPDLLFEHLGS
ncbi:MAG: alpha/beta fold hydrolase [Actinomycetota bacterium]